MSRKSNAVERRTQIVWGLFDCLAEKSAESVTIKDIAAKAGLPPGVIHYYFDSKDAIYAALAYAFIDRYGAMLSQRLDQVGTIDQRIDLLLDFLVDDFIFNQPLNRAFYNLILSSFGRPVLREAMQTALREYRTRLAGVFEGLPSRETPEAMAAALVAVTEGFAIQWIIDGDAFDRTQVRGFLKRSVRDRLADRALAD